MLRRLPRHPTYLLRPRPYHHHHLFFRLSRSISTPPPPQSSRVLTVFGALLCLGIGATAYGIYEFYSTFTMWPPELRGDLRAGLKAKHHGDLALSAKYLQRAWETAQTLPIETLTASPYLKLSGIGIAFAGVLEENDRPQLAYDVYVNVLKHLQKKRSTATAEERMRIVAVAYKLGEMAEMYQQPPAEEEKWLSLAVEELLRLAKESPRKNPDTSHSQQGLIIAGNELELPDWVSKLDFAAPIEALGAFYARSGNVEYAIPLYLQAISILIPSPSSKSETSQPEDRCRGALLMNNLSELILRGSPPTPENLHQAEAWAKQALETVKRTIKEDGDPHSQTCESALAVILINLGSLREMLNDPSSAREFFMAGLEQSKSIKMKEGIVEAQAALRRLDRVTISKPSQ